MRPVPSTMYTHTMGRLNLTGGVDLLPYQVCHEFGRGFFGHLPGRASLSLDLHEPFLFALFLSLHKEAVLDIGAAFGYLAGRGTYSQTYERNTRDYGTQFMLPPLLASDSILCYHCI